MNEARLDEFIISKTMTDIVDNTNIRISYYSDYFIIELIELFYQINIL